MSKQTLLDMTQEILSAMSSDEVNSISDSSESLQVATIIKRKYYDIVSRGDLPEHNQVFQLNPSFDTTQPVMMRIPDGVGHIEWIKYFNSNPLGVGNLAVGTHGLNVNVIPNSSSNITFTSTTSNTIAIGTLTFTVVAGLNISVGNSVTITATPGNTMTGSVASYSGTTLVVTTTSVTGSGTFASWTFVTPSTSAPPGYSYVTMLPIQQFLDITTGFNPADTNVKSFNFKDTSNNFPGGGFTFYYKNDRQPSACCILSNYYVIFDSFDSTQENTLESSKTMCFGQVVPTFQMVDSFIPDLDSQQFPLLVNEAKALAFFELKQQPHAFATQEVKRQWSAVQKNKSINNRPTYFNELANYGRRAGNYFGTQGFSKSGNYT